MTTRKIFLLEKSGRTPTESSMIEMIRPICEKDNELSSFKTYSGIMFNDPAYLRKKLKLSSIVVLINADNIHYNVIQGEQNIAELQQALASADKLSSWQIVNSALGPDQCTK